jgi:hypothetical protein
MALTVEDRSGTNTPAAIIGSGCGGWYPLFEVDGEEREIEYLTCQIKPSS